MFGSIHDSKGGKIQVACTEKYAERVEGIFFEVVGIMWSNFVGGLALLLYHKKCLKFTKSGIKIFKSDLKTEIIFSFLFYARNGCYGVI